ncbi:MAG: tetratricopeptide repeat protein [Armatimonadota bacterium]
MKTRTDRYETELRDPALTALLRETFADDPALAESPGRSERIMRRILASDKRPARSRAFWAPFGWAAGAVGLAALAIAFALGFLHLPQGGQIARDPKVVPQPAPQVVVDNTPVNEKIEPINDNEPVVTPTTPDRPQRIATEKRRTTRLHPVSPEKRAPERPVVTAAAEGSEHVAATLYSAGVAAQSTGDNESALEAYQASYDTVPTPEALLASARILESMGEETLSLEGS